MGLDIQRYVPRRLEGALEDSLRSFPVTAVLGPRQCGKSTLVRHTLSGKEKSVYLDLERPSDLRKLDDPEFFLSTQHEQLVCIDEVQRKPELFQVLRVLVDEDRRPGKYLILGSASQDLIRQSSETLAGRIHYLELSPFGYDELPAGLQPVGEDHIRLWMRGGFPDSILAYSDGVSYQWREDFIRTFLERDIPQFGFSIPAPNMLRLWTMLAHYHGQTLNASKLAQSLDISSPTVARYLNILAQTFMVRVLPPYFANIKKRLVKAPKVYIRDTGILHALLNIEKENDLFGHPVLGASWEGFCLEQIVTFMDGWRPSFYRTSSGEEIDLILERGRKKFAFEFKASMSPRVSRGFPGSIEVLQPDKTWIVAPVKESYPLRPGVEVAGIRQVLEAMEEEKAGRGV